MKKWISVILAVLLTLSVFPFTVFAEEVKKGEVDLSKPPVILIDGINAVDLVRDMGKKEERTAFPFTADDVVSLVRENAAAIWDMLDGDYTEENRDTLLSAVYGLLEDIAMNDDGTSKYDISVDWVFPGQERPAYIGEPEDDGGFDLREPFNRLKAWFYSLFRRDTEELTEEERFEKMLKDRSTYKFRYDWRLSQYECAEELKSYIDYMKELTGHDTVTLVGFSQGATVLNAYLSEYGYEGLDAVIWYAGAHNGVELVGQLFTGRIRVDAAALTEYVRDSGDSSSFSYELITCFMDALKGIGVTGNLLNYTNNIIKALLADGSIRGVIRNTFAKMPAIWGLISDDYYEEAKAYVFNQPGDAETYAELIETIDRYHYNVQTHAGELIDRAKAQTGKIGVISKYGLRVTPLIEDDRVQADGIIDVKGSSFGATAAPYGRTLGEGYAQAVADGHNHLSADGVIDASTARYPEYTWFIKNLPHSSISDYVYELFNEIAYADGQFTVWDSADYPQFAVYEPIEGVCSPLEDGSSQNAFTRALVRIKMFFRSLFSRVKSYFVKDEE